MKKTTISLAVAAIVVAVLGWGAAGLFAQPWGWGWGGSHASTAAEGAAYGMADVIRAQGDYNLNTSAAAINMTQAQRNDIENRQKWTETYFEMRRINKAYHDSLKKTPSPDAMARYAAAGKPKRLSANDFDAVSGTIRWPELLQSDKYNSQRGQLDALFAERASKGAATKGQRDQVRSLTGAMIDGLQQDIDSLPPQDYVGAKQFLNSLAYEATLPAS
jgi:hypothetical protein